MGKRTRRADRAELGVRRLLAALPGPDELAMAKVELVPTEGPSAGSRPAGVAEGDDGRRFFFKMAPPEHVAAEIFAYEVRALGSRPTVPTAARRLAFAGGAPVAGMLQPLVEHAGVRLPTDPTQWTELQREVLLREHPWEWLLGNLDTHIDQYVLVGPDRVPLNIDWDHALEDLEIDELDRFTKRSFAIAPIRNALYDAFARGDIELNLRGLRREVRRIARIDEEPLRAALHDWAVRAGVTEDRADRVAARFFSRKRAIGTTFQALMTELVHERAARRRPDSLPIRMRARIAINDAWQRLVIDSLHDKVVIPWLRLYRRALAVRAALGLAPETDRRRGRRR